MFDTLTYANKLKEAGFTERQAQAQAEALVAVIDSNLATKADIEAIKADIEALRLATKADIEALRQSTKLEIETLRHDTRADIAEAKTEIVKWCIGSVFASVGLFAALVKLMG